MLQEVSVVAGVLVAALVPAFAVAYQLGKHSQRITSLEEWRQESREQHKDTIAALERIWAAVRAQ